MNKNLTVEIHANTKQAIADINKLKSEIKQFSQNVKSSNSSLEKQKESLTSLSSSVKNLALAYGGFEVVKGAISTIADFEQSIAKLGAISTASTEQLDTLKAKARELGESTRYSASQVAEAMNYEAMSGMKTNEILTSTKDILNLANVGQLDLAKASDIATDSMSAFGLKAEDMGHITDVMASTITNSNTNIEQLGEAFTNVAPVAKNLGLTIGETSGMLGILANAGKKGGEAGTHLKIILQRLASTTKPVIEGLKEIGINAYDSNGKLKPLTGTLKDIQGKLKNLSERKRNEILKDLFGSEAISSANIILNNLEQMDTLIKKVSDSDGQAAEMSKKFNDTLKAKWDTLKSALQELALAIGDDLLPALSKVTEDITTLVRETTEFYKENKTLIDTIAELATVMYGLRKLKAVIEAVIGIEALAGVTSFRAGIVALRTSFISLAGVAAPIGILAVAIGGVIYKLNEMQESIDKLNDSSKRLSKSTQDSKDIFDEVNSSYSKTNDTFNLTKKSYDELGESIGNQVNKIQENIDATKNASDGSIEYKEQLAQLERQKKVLINTYDTVSKKLNIVKDTREKATDSTKKAISANKDLVSNTKETSDAELKAIRTTYKSRIKSHENTVKQLENKEITLKNKIIKLNEDLAKQLKSIDNERVASREDLQTKIHNLEMVGSSDIDKYHDKERQADEALSKAKIALKNGELSEYKRYKGIYEGLVSSIANTEIKDGERVLVSKKESADYGITALEELKKLDDDYYSSKKSQAITLHNEKIAQIRAELTATKAQLQLEVQRLNLEKQLIQAVTGKKVDIDTSSALKSIEDVDKQINSLDSQIKIPKKLSVDNSQAVSAVENVRSRTLTLRGKTLTINANTTPADFGIDKFISKHDGNKVTIKLNPEYKEAEKKINNAIKGFESKKVTASVTANTSKADSKIGSFQRVAAKEVTTKLNANISNAQSAINRVKNLASKSVTFKVNVNASNALSVIRNLQRNTSSTHTIYIRKVEQHNIGGMVGEVMKLATGGVAEFERKQGRIAGYDPTDSDDVPALLTRGEFVIKRDTVEHYGDDFLHKLNNKKVDLPGFAVGGSVGKVSVPSSNSITNGKTVNLNLNLGGKEFKMMSDEDVATSLANYLERSDF